MAMATGARSITCSGSTLSTNAARPSSFCPAVCFRAEMFGSGVEGLRAKQRRTSSGRRNLRIMSLFGLGVPELVVIAGVAALVFGPKKLPEIGKSLGKTVKSFQQAANEFQAELTTEKLENEKKTSQMVEAKNDNPTENTENVSS